jgi:hypothetical protein
MTAKLTTVRTDDPVDRPFYGVASADASKVNRPAMWTTGRQHRNNRPWKHWLNVSLGRTTIRGRTTAPGQRRRIGCAQSAAMARNGAARFPVGLHLLRRPNVGFCNTPALLRAGDLPLVPLG